jgi:formylglycine-generating enzyme required for sulfatase activity
MRGRVALAIVFFGAAGACGLDFIGEAPPPPSNNGSDGGAEGGFRDTGGVPPSDDGGGDADASIGDGGDGSTSGCLGMIATDAGFCIDATEVTQADYQLFLLATVGADAATPGPCSFKKTHVPDDAGDGANICDWNPVANATRPVVCADWCDAKAYCEWAGKRLCGQIGDGGAVPTNKQTTVTVDEWYFACTANGARAFPYGDVFDPAACNGSGAGPPVAAGSKAACVGGLDGLHDMSGNVLEWENSCDGTAPNDNCRSRGGSWFYTNEADLRCDAIPNGPNGSKLPRGTRLDDTGVRCCKSM